MLLLFAVRCQPAAEQANQAASQPATPSPTISLIPPIQRGDGSDLMDRLLDTGVIRVGIRVWPDAEFSPPAFRGFSNTVTGGALNGFEVDLAHQLADGLGLELELIEAYPPVIASGDWRGQWDIALASLVPFDQPAAPGTTPLFFSEPYGYMPMGVLVASAEGSPQTLAQLSGRRIGVLEYSAYQDLLAPQGQALTVQGQPVVLPSGLADIQPVPVSNLAKAIHELAEPEPGQAAQLQAIFGPAPILQEAIKSELPVKLINDADQMGLLPLVVAVVPQDRLKVDRLRAEINKILARLQHQGALSEIYLRWYSQDLSRLP